VAGDVEIEGGVAINVGETVVDVGEDRETEDPEVGREGPAVMGSTLGKKVELISPMPMKKSSVEKKIGLKTEVKAPQIDKTLTRNDLDKIRTPLPHIRSVVNDHHHTCIARE